MLEPQGWAGVGDSLASLIDGATVHMFLVSGDTGRTYVNLFANGDPDFAPTYLTDYAADDFRVARVLARPPGVFAPERAYVSESDARQSRIHQELLPRFGIHEISGANLSFGTCIGWFGIARSRPGDCIDGASSQLLSAVSPHLLRAFRLVQRQADLDLPAPSANVADLQVTAVFVFEAEQLVQLNRSAERVLADGWVRLGKGGQLTCADRKNSALLAAFHADRRVEALPLRDPDTGAVHMLRRMEGVWPRQQRQVLTLTQLTPPPPQCDEMEAFCEPFGLSPAEQRAVRAVLASQPLSVLARKAGISLFTAQDQLKSAMQKIGLPSQKLIIAAFERFRAASISRIGEGRA